MSNTTAIEERLATLDVSQGARTTKFSTTLRSHWPQLASNEIELGTLTAR